MRRRSLCCAFFHAAILFVAGIVEGGDPSLPQPEKVVVQIQVLEVATEKLRNLGFDWSRIRPTGTTEKVPVDKVGDLLKSSDKPEQFLGFLEALQQNNLARMLAEPTLVTLSGRPASLEIADHLKLDVVPVVLGDGRIRLEYRIEIASTKPKDAATRVEREVTSTPLRLDAAVDLEAGKTTLVNHTRFHSANTDDKRRELELLVFARAELWKPDALPVAARPGTYIEVPRSSK
jgi:hypothetical protein